MYGGGGHGVISLTRNFGIGHFAIFRPNELKFSTRILRDRLLKFIPKIGSGTILQLKKKRLRLCQAIEFKICTCILSDAYETVSPNNIGECAFWGLVKLSTASTCATEWQSPLCRMKEEILSSTPVA